MSIMEELERIIELGSHLQQDVPEVLQNIEDAYWDAVSDATNLTEQEEDV